MICDSPQVPWWRDVWCHFIPFSRSALTWRLLLNRLPTEDRLCRAEFHLASRCSVCGVSSESSDHLFIRCPLAVALWETVFSVFQQRISADTWSSFFSQTMSVSFSDQSKTMDFRSALSFVRRAVSDANRLEIECMRNCVDDLLILRRFDLRGRPARAPVIRSVIWSPPAPGWTKVNTDGAALSSPASIAINFTWHNGWHRIRPPPHLSAIGHR
ncbi:hypothetical protein Ddye_007338 [Dipteronia dyeriana]|uniref:Reverse transcriptase zinc-binding domain-containing protein n=1 Tax=Dipteronia dyeriana TaxID=168575 RepID=A0AAE0CRD3_9ROSI|nr:hypothetical protein Ddye_007338 [Dipteronia dyeriana]